MDRRAFLQATGGGAVAILAGCLGSEGNESDAGGTNDESKQDQEASSGSNSDESAEGEGQGDPQGGDGDPLYEVHILYGGSWAGNVGADGNSRSVDGTGSEGYAIHGEPATISANAQKQDDSMSELVVEIYAHGELVNHQATTAAYGVAQATYSTY